MTESSAASGSKLGSIPNSELDAYIAELIIQKSRAKQAQADAEGIGAYLKDDHQSKTCRIPNTNKRFLASVIQNVEGHNRALLRQQAREGVEKYAPSAKGKGKERTGPSAATPTSRMRGWSDDEDSFTDRNAEVKDVTDLSSKMGRHFEEQDAPPDQIEASSRPDRSNRQRRAKDEEQSAIVTKRRKNEKEARSHKCHHEREHRHRPESRRDKVAERGDKQRRPFSSSKNEPQETSSHRRRSDKRGHDQRREKRHLRRRAPESKSEQTLCVERKDQKRSSHTNRINQRRSASPEARPPKKVREWDLGKQPLAF